MRNPSYLGFAVGPALVAVGVLALGSVVVWATGTIPTSPLYAKVGPKVFPYGIGIGLLLLGLKLLWEARGQGWACEATDPNEPALNLSSLGWIAGAFALGTALIGFIGFILTATLVFVGAARSFEARSWLRSILIGFLLVLLAYFGFARLLGLRMGEGFIESLI